jgi:hypothetical protein
MALTVTASRSVSVTFNGGDPKGGLVGMAMTGTVTVGEVTVGKIVSIVAADMVTVDTAVLATVVRTVKVVSLELFFGGDGGIRSTALLFC